LLDGIAQTLEDETVANVVFGVLMLQVPNLQQQVTRQHGGSLQGHSPNVTQECKVSHSQVVRNYFTSHSIYNNWLFHRRY